MYEILHVCMKLRLWLVADHIHGDNKWNPTLSARSWPNSIFFFFDSLRSLSLDNLTVSTFCWPIVDSVNFSSNKQLVIVRSSSTYNLVITQKLHNSKERICIYIWPLFNVHYYLLTSWAFSFFYVILLVCRIKLLFLGL